MIRVLLVDDSVTVRKQIARILSEEQGMAVAGEAANGRQAVDANKKLRPDVIIMDLDMPIMSGPEAVERIMTTLPCPIVILSSFLNRGEKFKTWNAMLAGAVARIEKTDAEKNPLLWEKELVRTVQAAARIKVGKSCMRLPAKGGEKSIEKSPPDNVCSYNVIAIGGSTGCLGVIVRIMDVIPAGFGLPILLVVHLADTQDSTFGQWLGSHCRLPVAFAGGGEKLTEKKAHVLIAPPHRHMIVTDGVVRLDKSEPVNYCRPSVDVLFDSLSRDNHLKPIGVLLTGIGRDGACGLKTIKDQGGYTICQDEKTSTVFGMPGAAIQMDSACAVLPDYEIASKILELTGSN